MDGLYKKVMRRDRRCMVGIRRMRTSNRHFSPCPSKAVLHLFSKKMGNKRKGTDLEEPVATIVTVPSPRSTMTLKWEETKNRLKTTTTTTTTTTSDWLSQLDEVHQMDRDLQEVQEEIQGQASSVQKDLEERIKEARDACREESDEVYRLQQRVREMTADCEELEQTVEDHRMEASQIQERIYQYKEEASQEIEEMDRVEADRIQQVPKLKHQISLFAKITGIKWDYQEDKLLAGQVVSSFLFSFPKAKNDSNTNTDTHENSYCRCTELSHGANTCLAFPQIVPDKGVIERFAIDHWDLTDFEIANFLWDAIEGATTDQQQLRTGTATAVEDVPP